MLSFFPRGVLNEILNLIESVSEGFPSYSFMGERIYCVRLFASLGLNEREEERQEDSRREAVGRDQRLKYYVRKEKPATTLYL